MKLKEISTLEDRLKFISTWKIVFNRNIDKTTSNWLFNQNNHIYCAIDNDKVVAGYCLLKTQAYINSKLLNGVLCNNIFIHGFKYQKQGLFKDLTNFSLYNAKSNYDFAIGFPNQKAIKAHIRCGWQQEENISFLEYKNQHSGKLNNFKIQWLDTKDKFDLQVLVNCFALKNNYNYSFLIHKTKNYLKWRFIDNPRCGYQIGLIFQNNTLVGFFISKYFHERNRIHLVDYCFSNLQHIKCSVNHIFQYYNSNGKNADIIDAWIAKADYDKFLEANFTKSGDFSYSIYKDLQDQKTSFGDMPHIVLADNDVY